MNLPPDVKTLAQKALEPHLERQRFTALTIPRLDLGPFLVEILSKANDFVPSEAGSFLMDRPGDRVVGGEGPNLYFLAAFGPSADTVLGRTLHSSDGVVGRVYRTGEPYLMVNPPEDRHFCDRFDAASDFKTTGVVAVPIRIEQTVCGVLELVNRKSGTYTSQDIGILEVFGAYTSVFLENLLDARRAGEMARRDDLSGLYNDRFFHHRLTEDLVRADVAGAEVALLFLDLDNFKGVNDTLGHLAGSQVLKEFAVVLSQAVDVPEATLARYGGDEFVVILPGFDSEAAAEVGERVCEALRKATFLRGSFTWAEGPVSLRSVLTVSVGVAVYPMHLPRTGSTDLKKNLLMRAADLAMYRAKEEGKDRVVVAPVLSP
ncbi:MAG: sensor domain-containing diguanylate cyclase [Acidobacteriota bacterium]